jgi:hypothetical protein
MKTQKRGKFNQKIVYLSHVYEEYLLNTSSFELNSSELSSIKIVSLNHVFAKPFLNVSFIACSYIALIKKYQLAFIIGE